MRRVVAGLVLLAVETAFSDSRAVPRGPDVDDLYARLSESALVVRGRALEIVPVTRRVYLPSKQVGPNLWEVDPRNLEGGTLFAIAVEETICRQSDFGAAQPATAPSPSRVHVFVLGRKFLPTEPSRFDPGLRNRQEFLIPGREYLLFLWEQPGQEALVKTYKLEPGVTYYRAMEGERGAVALPDGANPEKPHTFVTPLVQAVTTFCEAVKGPDAPTKIRQLQGVRNFFDYPAWRQSVDQAVHAFQNPAPVPIRQPQ